MTLDSIPMISGAESGIAGHAAAFDRDRFGVIDRVTREVEHLGRLRFPTRDIVVANSPSSIHELFVTNAKHFAKSPAIRTALYPLAGEPVIDKPGKGAFFATDLMAILQHSDLRQIVVTGVTTEVCVNTTVREANDRGFDCLVPSDCVGSYFPEFQEAGLKMIKAQGGIFGWVSDSQRLLSALA